MNGDPPVNIAGVFAFPNDEGSRQIRFIDSGYNTLFYVPDGGNIILTTFNDWNKYLACRYIDDFHAVIGGSTYHICEFAEISERNGSVYAPEHPQEGDICDTYTIYQIKDTRAVPYSYEPFALAKTKLQMADYTRAYRGVLAPKVTLEDLLVKHNRGSRPFDQRMRSLSISDVIVINRGGVEKAYYVDRSGFEEAKKFLDPPFRKRSRSGWER